MRVSTQYELAIIIVVSLLIGLSIFMAIFKPLKEQKHLKYDVISSNGVTLLIDKENGFVWRNIRCGDNNVPACWEYMDYMGAIVPDGEQRRRDAN